jgi:hypothetical protein
MKGLKTKENELFNKTHELSNATTTGMRADNDPRQKGEVPVRPRMLLIRFFDYQLYRLRVIVNRCFSYLLRRYFGRSDDGDDATSFDSYIESF